MYKISIELSGKCDCQVVACKRASSQASQVAVRLSLIPGSNMKYLALRICESISHSEVDERTGDEN